MNLSNALYDFREADNIRTVNVDVSMLKTAYSSSRIQDSAGGTSGTGGDGLLLYINDRTVGKALPATQGTTSVTSSGKRGVRLVNGASLPSATGTNGTTGFSVVSPNPIYIQGDYNTGSSGTTQPASNTATSYTPPTDAPSSTVPGYTRVPSAVVGDAVSILSNSWTDAASNNSTRPASSSTTVNTAIIAGNVPSVSGGSYSGGIENFVRFLEDWGGKYFTQYGALASLYASTQATGPWSSAKYGVPYRRWYYDPNFRDSNPPGFQPARTYERGSWKVAAN